MITYRFESDEIYDADRQMCSGILDAGVYSDNSGTPGDQPVTSGFFCKVSADTTTELALRRLNLDGKELYLSRSLVIARECKDLTQWSPQFVES